MIKIVRSMFVVEFPFGDESPRYPKIGGSQIWKSTSLVDPPSVRGRSFFLNMFISQIWMKWSKSQSLMVISISHFSYFSNMVNFILKMWKWLMISTHPHLSFPAGDGGEVFLGVRGGIREETLSKMVHVV